MMLKARKTKRQPQPQILEEDLDLQESWRLHEESFDSRFNLKREMEKKEQGIEAFRRLLDLLDD